jgi:hypothetical protein
MKFTSYCGQYVRKPRLFKRFLSISKNILDAIQILFPNLFPQQR